MERHQSLDDVLEQVWSYFEGAAEDPGHAGRTPTVATAGPDARTVVLRRVDRGSRSLLFHTDSRSGKMQQLIETPEVVWHDWNPDLAQQFRLYGQASLHESDDLAQGFWEDLGDEERAHYQKEEAPGSALGRPRSTHPDTDPVADAPESPRDHFAVVRTVVERIDWLHLHPEGHYRAVFEWTAGSFQGEWVAP